MVGIVRILGLRRTWGAVVAALVAAGAALVLGTASPATAAEEVPAPTEKQLSQARAVALANPLAYQVRTRIKSGNTCGGERTITGLYGVPLAVDVGGSFLPDVLVEVIPIPALPPITDKTVLSVSVVKLALGPLNARVEAILAPSGPNDPDRIALGYDGCESGVPTTFGLTAVQSDTNLALRADTLLAPSTLTVLGSRYQLANNTETEATRVAARFAPVPAHLTTSVDLLPDSKYKAHVTTSKESQVRLDFLNQAGQKSTNARVELKSLPEEANVSFSSAAVSYTTSTAIREAAVDVTSTAPGSKTSLVSARLGGLPLTASFERVEDRAVFTTPGVLGSATVRYATFNPGTALPATPTSPNQYGSARITDELSVLDVRLLGVRTSSVDLGDTVKLNLQHLAGPFDVDVASSFGTVKGAIRDLPEKVDFSYGQTSHQISYAGSATIGQLTLDVDAVEPIVGDADKAHLDLRSLPTGLTGSVDRAAKRFSVEVSGGQRIGKVSALFTTGPTETLDPSTDGVQIVERLTPSKSSLTFVRLSEIARASVQLSEPISVSLSHRAGPFQIALLQQKIPTGKTEVNTRTVTGRIDALPESVAFTYDSESHSFDYQGAAPIGQLDVDVTSDPSPIAGRGNHLHLLAKELPTNLALRVNLPNGELESFSATTGGQRIGLLEVALDRGSDQRELLGENDGFLLVDMKFPDPFPTPETVPYYLFARATGLQNVSYSEVKDGGKTTTVVDATLLGGRDLMLNLRKFGGSVQGGPFSLQGKKEGYTYFEATLQKPPTGMHLELTEDQDTTRIDYRAHDPANRPAGSALEIATNKGNKRSRLTANVTPVPATAQVCITPDERWCAAESHHKFPDGTDEDLTNKSSYGINVSEPIHLSFRDCKEELIPFDPTKLPMCNEEDFPRVPTETGKFEANRTELELDVERRLVLLKMENECAGPNCKVVGIDTADRSLTGTIRQRHALYPVRIQGQPPIPGPTDFDTELRVTFPEGFRTDDRISQINCDIFPRPRCKGEHSEGKAACPSDFLLESETAVGNLEFQEEWCPGARLDSLSPSALPRGATDEVVDLFGAGFSPDARVIFGPGVAVSGLEWVDYGHLRATVTVSSGAALGKRDVTVINPDDAGADTRQNAFEVLD